MDPQGRYGQRQRRENLWSPSGFEFQSAQLLTNRYTDYVIPAARHRCGNCICPISRGCVKCYKNICCLNDLIFVERREENQQDVTECFIALMIRSTCFGHFYAHHQKLETICVLLPPMVCSAVRVKRYD